MRTREESCQSTAGRPGALTELLAELVQAPRVEDRKGPGWELPLAAGESVGRFEILREVGRGGFGVVYEARDSELGRSVAFKAVRTSGLSELKADRLLAEAEAAARLAHPNIVHLYDLGKCDRGAFLILELLHGKTLSDRLHEGPLPPREALRVAVEASRGLAHAHAQGVVHRDLKPGNVFLCEDGQVKLLDFGLAHVFGKGGERGGTPAYMAPEQAKGEAGDERSDVFGLGVMLFELLTGKLPFADGEKGIPEGGKAPAIEGAPAALEKLVGRMLAGDPGKRPATGEEAYRELLAIQRSLEPRRGLRLALLVSAGAVVGAAIFAWIWQRPLPPGRLLTAIADTDNQTGDPDLDAVGTLLATGLEQSKRISLMARSRLVNTLREAGRKTDRIDEALAREAALATKADLLLVPAVRHEGSGYAVSLRGIGPVRGDALFELKEVFGAKKSVRDVLDRISDRTLQELREDPRDAAVKRLRVADAFSESSKAWRHYEAYQRHYSEGWSESERKADIDGMLAADPDFPIARLLRGLANAGGRARYGVGEEQTERDWEVARANIDKVPPKERALVEALSVWHSGGTQEDMLKILERVMNEWPEEPLAYQWFVNASIGRRAELPRARIEKALAVASLHPAQRIDYLLFLGHVDEALEATRRYSADRPDPMKLARLAKAHRWRGDAAAALAAARQSVELDTTPLDMNQWLPFVDAGALEEVEKAIAAKGVWGGDGWLALRGRWRERLALLDSKAPARTAASDKQARHHAKRMSVLALGGASPDAVWHEVEEWFRFGGYDDLCGKAWLLALSGDVERASRMVGWEAPFGPARVFKAIRRWKAGERELALRDLESIYGYTSTFYRGRILAELGRDREAVDTFRLFRRTPDPPILRYDPELVATNYALSLYHEAVSLDRLGERDEARRLLDRLLRLWNHADASQPMLREARALRRRLDGAPRAAAR